MSTQQNQLDPYYQTLTDEKVTEEFKSYEEEFRDKTYYEKYKQTAKNTEKFSKLFNVLSVMAGTLGAAIILAMFIYPNPYIMIAPAVILLGIAEYFKRDLLTKISREKVKGKGISKGLAIACIMLLMVSMSAAIYGGIELVNISRGKTKPELTSTKKIEAKYNAKINEKKALQKAITDRNTYKGKTYLPKDERLLNAKYDADIRQLEKDQKAAITKAKTDNKAKLTSHYEGTFRYAVGFAIMTLAIEVLCVVTIYFPIHFRFKAQKDRKVILKKYESQNPNILLNLLVERLGVNPVDLIKQLQINQSVLLNSTSTLSANTPTPAPVAKAAKPQKPIGFTTAQNTHPSKEPTKGKRRERGTTVDYELINNLLLNTNKTTHQIAMQAKCSDTSVRNAKKKLIRLGLLPKND